MKRVTPHCGDYKKYWRKKKLRKK